MADLNPDRTDILARALCSAEHEGPTPEQACVGCAALAARQRVLLSAAGLMVVPVGDVRERLRAGIAVACDQWQSGFEPWQKKASR
jgi:hypothetical protein